jgi:PAS domain S-box-containing protein
MFSNDLMKKIKSRTDDNMNLGDVFEQAIIGTSAGIWLWYDVEKEEEWWSPQFYKLLGYDNDEIKASVSAFTDLLHPDDIPACTVAVKKHFAREADFNIEYRLRAKNGTYKWFLGNGQANWDEDGKPKRMIGTIIDISERKKTAHALDEKMKELEFKSEEQEQFVYITSHDLQEPLRTISSFTYLLTNEYSEQLDENANTYLRYITQATNGMMARVTGLLEYSRIGRKKIRQLVSASSILKEVKQNLSNQIMKTKAKINIPKNLPQINVNEVEIQMLFQNLISNAIKFTVKGQKPNITVNCADHETEWQFSVQDNGIGIEPKHFNKIFIIFQQLNESSTYSGTGIGLSYCQKIVELHAGKIWVESSLNKGSTFCFTIPK